jgi:hypothetical protein
LSDSKKNFALPRNIAFRICLRCVTRNVNEHESPCGWIRPRGTK